MASHVESIVAMPQSEQDLPLGNPVVDAAGLRPDACLAKVVDAASHFVEQVASTMTERAPHRWRRSYGCGGAGSAGAAGVGAAGGGAGGQAGEDGHSGAGGGSAGGGTVWTDETKRGEGYRCAACSGSRYAGVIARSHL